MESFNTHLRHSDIPGEPVLVNRLFLFIVDCDRRIEWDVAEELAAAMTGQIRGTYNCDEDIPRAVLRWSRRVQQKHHQECAWIAEALADMFDEEGSPSFFLTVETPGWIGDGRGKCFRIDQAPPLSSMLAEHPWYAYQSLGLWWTRALSAEEQRFLCQQARAYATLSGRIAIEGSRFVQRETTETCLVSRDPEGAERTGPPWR
jgi:hypothetical protein